MISIIVPLYNSEIFVKSFLNKLLLQSFRNYELILVDGKSTDNTLKILKEYKSNFKNINIFSESDKGIYDAMNKGISNAKGEWLYFMGADDSFVNENVLQNVSPFLNAESDIVYGDSVWMPENIKEEGEWTYPVFINRNINHQRIFYRKELFQQYGGLNLKYKIASDHELNIRFFCNEAIRKKYIPITITEYYSGGFSAHKIDKIFWDDWKKIVYKNFKSHLPKKVIYSSLGFYCRYCIYQKKYAKAFKNILAVFIHTKRLGFLKLMGSHFIKSLSKNAA